MVRSSRLTSSSRRRAHCRRSESLPAPAVRSVRSVPSVPGRPGSFGSPTQHLVGRPRPACWRPPAGAADRSVGPKARRGKRDHADDQARTDTRTELRARRGQRADTEGDVSSTEPAADDLVAGTTGVVTEPRAGHSSGCCDERDSKTDPPEGHGTSDLRTVHRRETNPLGGRSKDCGLTSGCRRPPSDQPLADACRTTMSAEVPSVAPLRALLPVGAWLYRPARRVQ
jgi:hypothetical protein